MKENILGAARCAGAGRGVKDGGAARTLHVGAGYSDVSSGFARQLYVQ